MIILFKTGKHSILKMQEKLMLQMYMDCETMISELINDGNV